MFPFFIRAIFGSFARTVLGKAVSKVTLKRMIKNVEKSSVSNAQKQKLLYRIKKLAGKNLFLKKIINKHINDLEKYGKDTAEDLTLNTLLNDNDKEKKYELQKQIFGKDLELQFNAPNITISKRRISANFESTWLYSGIYFPRQTHRGDVAFTFRDKSYIFPNFPLEWFLQMVYAKPKDGHGAGSIYWALYKNHSGARSRTSSYRNNIQLFLEKWRIAYANKYRIL